MTETLLIPSPEAMHALGVRMGGVLRAGDLVVLDGPLGAGKTTLTRGIGEGLDVRGPIASPTFVLARTHPPLHGGPALTHVDAYRLGSPAELDDLDLDEAGTVVVVEWGAGLVEGASSVLTVAVRRPVGGPDPAAEPDEADAPVEPRTVSISGRGPRWAGSLWAADAAAGARQGS